jgi:hypothetical protein
VIGSLVVLVSVLYGAAKHYSPSLVLYVVEQSLIQKAPPGNNLPCLHQRLRTYISAAPDKNSQMEKLFRISEYLERVQHVSFEQIDELLAVGKPENPGISRLPGDQPENTRP